MTRVGYARISLTEQDLEIQVAKLKAAGCKIIRSEAGPDISRSGQTELNLILQGLRAGDELVVHRLDRLALPTRDVLKLIGELHDKGASLRVLEPEVTTAGSMGRMVMTILGMVADMELKFIKERQSAGIKAAKASGVYKGRVKNVDDDEIRRRIGEGATKAGVARALKISRMTVYRALEDIPDRTSLPDKRPSGMLTLRIGPPARSIAKSRVAETVTQIEALLERDYSMKRTGKGEYLLKAVYDYEPDGMSFNDEIELLSTAIARIMEEHQCVLKVEMVKGPNKARAKFEPTR